MRLFTNNQLTEQFVLCKILNTVAFAEICQKMKLNLSIYDNIKLVFGNSINGSVSHLHETNKVSF